MIRLDKVDRAILRMLQEDAKTDIKVIADNLHMTKTPIYERIRKLEREGVIEKYVARVDRDKISSSMVVFCNVELENQKLDQIEKFSKDVSKIPEVMECYLLGGSSDFLLKVIVADLNEYHEFSSGKLAVLPNVSHIKSSFVLNEVKQSTVLPGFS